ncbi:MAG: beta-lactamase family protein [Bacteroidetes bacterium]|nr:beta-lactamase family protein [Bacteroidota bacterium]
MKTLKINCLILLSFLIYNGNAQQSANSHVNLIIKHYNDNDLDSLYFLLASNFQKEFPKEIHHEFYKNSIKAAYGKLNSIERKSSNKDGDAYIANFENGKLILLLRVSENGIESVQWLPPDQAETPKRNIEEIKSDNKKADVLDVKIDSIVLDYLREANTSGMSIAVLHRGKIRYYNYGETDKKTKRLPALTTIYEIGSITKTFTGIMLANAVLEGKIKLEDDIRKYIGNDYSNLSYKNEPIRIKHLCTHTSLLPSVPMDVENQVGFKATDPYKNYTSEMLFAYLKTIKLDTIPGSKYEYSNVGFALLANILEKVYKLPLESLFEKYITKPNRMNNTSLIAKGSEEMAIGYTADTGLEAEYWNWKSIAGAGGIKSNIQDMAKYVETNLKSDNKAASLSHKKIYNQGQHAQGMAWVISPGKDTAQFIWHNGRTAGFSSVCGFIKELGFGVVVLSNSGMSCDRVGFGIIKHLMK